MPPFGQRPGRPRALHAFLVGQHLAGRLAHLRGRLQLLTYLRRTVVNLARSHYRHRKVERSYLERTSPGRGRIDAAPATDVEDRDALWHALAGLPARQRTALVLRFYEDLSERQIADVMRCPVGTVKSLVSRGLRTLRTQIGGEDR